MSRRPPCALASACALTVLVNLMDIVIHVRGPSGWESRCWSCVVQFAAVACLLQLPKWTKPTAALLSENGARGAVLLCVLCYYGINGAWMGTHDLDGRLVLFTLLAANLGLFLALWALIPPWWSSFQETEPETAASEEKSPA